MLRMLRMRCYSNITACAIVCAVQYYVHDFFSTHCVLLTLRPLIRASRRAARGTSCAGEGGARAAAVKWQRPGCALGYSRPGGDKPLASKASFQRELGTDPT